MVNSVENNKEIMSNYTREYTEVRVQYMANNSTRNLTLFNTTESRAEEIVDIINSDEELFYPTTTKRRSLLLKLYPTLYYFCVLLQIGTLSFLVYWFIISKFL